MKEPASLNQAIARRVRELRAAQHLSLDALAARTGVSRSMISLIERAQTSPTAAVLGKLAAGLNVVLASLFDSPKVPQAPGPVSRRKDQIQWQDPASGYLRRNISPSGISQPIQIVEVQFPAGARVAFENAARDHRVYQQVWVLAGAIDIRVGDEFHELYEGDCLAMQLDQPILFHNPTKKSTRYAVVMVVEPHSGR